MLTDSPQLAKRWVRIVPHVVDTLLLASAIAPRRVVATVSACAGLVDRQGGRPVRLYRLRQRRPAARTQQAGSSRRLVCRLVDYSATSCRSHSRGIRAGSSPGWEPERMADSLIPVAPDARRAAGDPFGLPWASAGPAARPCSVCCRTCRFTDPTRRRSRRRVRCCATSTRQPSIITRTRRSISFRRCRRQLRPSRKASLADVRERILAEHARMYALWDELRPQLEEVRLGLRSSLDQQLVFDMDAIYRQHIDFEESRLLPLARQLVGRTSPAGAGAGDDAPPQPRTRGADQREVW